MGLFIENWYVIIGLLITILGMLWGPWLGIGIFVVGMSTVIIKLNAFIGLTIMISTIFVTIFLMLLQHWKFNKG
jgi:hypothetical protein